MVTASNATRGLDYPERVASRIRPSQVPEVPQPSRPGGKGRPTPKRKVAQAANRRPLVQDARTSAKASRTAAREQRDREYQALRSGDARNFPARDQGPVRAWVRDWVDARRGWREWAVPIAVVAFMLSIVSTANPYLYFGVNILIWVLMIWMIVSSVLFVRKIKRLATAKFGVAKIPPGIGMYGLSRSLMLRRSRLPRPRVERGAEVH